MGWEKSPCGEVVGHRELAKYTNSYIFVGEKSPRGDVIGHTELAKYSRSAIFVGKKAPAGMWLVAENLYGPAHCLVPRQHTGFFPNSIVFGYKTAH